MPLFYLRLLNRNGEVLPADEEPQDFDGLEGARTEAIESLRELAATAIGEGRPFNYTAIEITDENGKKVEAITAGDAVPQLACRA
jgi:hypothetical protein